MSYLSYFINIIIFSQIFKKNLHTYIAVMITKIERTTEFLPNIWLDNS